MEKNKLNHTTEDYSYSENYWSGWDQERRDPDISKSFSERHKKKKENYYDQLHNISQYIDNLLRHGDPNAQGIRSLAERIQKMIKL